MVHNFEVQIRMQEDGTPVLAVCGELDLAAAPQLRRVISSLMGSGTRHVVIDLGDATFVDSSGMGALLWAEHRMHAAGGELTAVNPQPNVARAFEIAGLGPFVR